MTKLRYFLAFLGLIFVTQLLTAQGAIKKPYLVSAPKTKVHAARTASALVAGKVIIDSILSDSYIDNTWIPDLYQVNYYNSDCLVIKDSVAIDFWDNGEWDPFFTEQYWYGNDGLLDEWLDITIDINNGVVELDSFRAVYIYSNGLINYVKFEQRNNGQWDSLSVSYYFYDNSGVLTHTSTVENVGTVVFYSTTEYSYDAQGNVIEELSSVGDNPNGPFPPVYKTVYTYTPVATTPLTITDYNFDGDWVQEGILEYSYTSDGLPTHYYYQIPLEDGSMSPYSRGEIYSRYGCETSAAQEPASLDLQIVMANPFAGGIITLEGKDANLSGLMLEVINIDGRILQQQPINDRYVSLPRMGHTGPCMLVVKKDNQIISRRTVMMH